MRIVQKSAKFIAMSMVALLASCTDGDGEGSDYDVPTSYNFENASYSGQVDRLNMLAELESYMKTANEGAVIDAAIAKSMYANEGYTWTSEVFADAQPSKDLKSKTFDTEQASIETLIDQLAELSVNGTLTTSENGEKTYLFDENGFEPIQLIAKGIMGSCFYYQGTSVYLSDAKMDVDNDVDALANGEYTAMQHHFDESFGYFGAPVEFSITNTDGGVYWGKYANKSINGGLETIDNLMQDGFILGRAAIDNKDYDKRDEAIATIRTEWEMIPVTSALHYLNGSIEDITDDALRNHQLSEAIAFISALKYNVEASITATEVDAIIAELGTNLYQVTPAMIDAARTSLADAYGISNADAY